MKKTWVILAVIAVTASGCAGTQYAKSGGTSESFARDKWACENQLGIASAIGDPLDKLAYMSVRGADDMRYCLASKGWNPALNRTEPLR